MAKSRILDQNVTLATATTLAASATATGYAVESLKNNKRGLPWRSTTTTGNQSVTVSFSSRTILAVFLLDPLIHAGGSVKIEENSGGYANFGGGTGICPAVGRTNLTGLYVPAGVGSVTDIRVTFTNTGAVSAYVQLGGVFIVDSAGYLQTTVNVTDSLSLGMVDPSESAVSLGGQESFNERTQYLRVMASYRWITAAQKDSLLSIRDRVGKRTPVIFAIDPDDMNKTVFGRFADAFIPQHAQRDQWNLDVPFREAL